MTAMEQALQRINWKPSDGRHRCGVHFETIEDGLAAYDKFCEDMGDEQREERN